MRNLLRIRDMRIYLLGDVVSTLGDSALWLAMAIWVKEMTGSSAWAGLVMFCFAVGNLFSPLGGAIADRFRRKPLLIWSNLIGAVLVLGILGVQGRAQMWVIYLVILLSGVLGSVISPAQTALVPRLVPEDLLAHANAAQQTLSQGLRMVTPLVGAGLFALVGGHVVAVIDAATFLAGAACMSALRVHEPSQELAREPAPEATAESAGSADKPGSKSDGMSAGFRFIGREPVLRSITLALALSLLAFGFTESAGFSVVTAGLHHKASFVGVLLAVQGAGAIVGGLVAASILKRIPEAMMTALGLSCAGVAVLLLTLPNLAPVLAGMLLAGLVGPWVSVAAITAIQRRTPGDLIGRVSGAFGLSLTIPQIISVGFGAALIAIISYRALLIAVAAVAAISVAFLVSQPQARRKATEADRTMPATDGADAGPARSLADG